MIKKEYMTPSVKVVDLDNVSILAGSQDPDPIRVYSDDEEEEEGLIVY